MKKYLVIAVLLIVPFIFFLHNSISNPSEFATYKNAQRPNPIQLAGFALGDDDPILMVNLLKFKDKANF